MTLSFNKQTIQYRKQCNPSNVIKKLCFSCYIQPLIVMNEKALINPALSEQGSHTKVKGESYLQFFEYFIENCKKWSY